MIQTKFSKAIQFFRRDNAMEYCDSKLLSFLGDQSTLSEFSCPYISQQNGCAERKHRHIIDSVLSQPFVQHVVGMKQILLLLILSIVFFLLSLVMSPF